MPTIQAIMTRHVSPSEQGQLQGANMSVASIAGVMSPLFFGAVYSWSLSEGHEVGDSGLAFLIAAGILLAAAALGWIVARRAERIEAHARTNAPSEPPAQPEPARE